MKKSFVFLTMLSIFTLVSGWTSGAVNTKEPSALIYSSVNPRLWGIPENGKFSPLNQEYAQPSTSFHAGEAEGFHIASVLPAPGTFSASPDSSIQAQFTEPVSGDFLTPTSITVHGSLSGTVAGTLSGAGTTTVSFSPSADLLPGETVTVIVTENLTALSGNLLTHSYTWQFTIATGAGPGAFSLGQLLSSSAYTTVSVGDINGDGYIDAFLGKNGQNEIWLNQGNGILVPVWTAPISDDTRDSVLFDVDLDGDLDIYVANKNNDTLWLNDNTAADFILGQTFSLNDSTSVIADDFDNDGFIDIYVTRYGSSDALLINDGTGNLQPGGSIPNANSNSNSAAVADFNGDGFLDLFIAIQGYNQVLLNQGAGVFATTWTSPSSRISYGLDAADFNGDGHTDILVANGNAPNEIWLSAGDGTFVDSGQTIGGNIWTADVKVTDFNGDGLPDVYLANGILSNPDKVLFSDTAGNLVDSGTVFDSRTSTAVGVADFNNDGFIDFLVTSTIGAELWLNITEGISIVSPVSSDTWLIGNTEQIAWTSFGVEGVLNIEISHDDGSTWVTVGTEIENTGTFDWTVNGQANSDMRIRITSASDPSITSISERFTISFPDPVAMDDSYQTGQDTELAVPPSGGILINDTFAGSVSLSASLVSGPTNGSLDFYSDGSFVYIPDPGYFGTDSFSYTADAGIQVSNIATVDITVIGNTNTPPAVVDDSYVTQKNEALVIAENEGVLTNDSDEENDSLTAVLITDVNHGQLSFQPDGSFQYIPSEGFSGTDTFVYQASDGTDVSVMATATITIEDNSPAITAEPADRSIVYGDTAEFHAQATSDPSPQAQWQQSLDQGQTWADIPGENNITLSLFQPGVSWSGRMFRAVFSNEYGEATSSVVTLTVSPRPVTVSVDPLEKVYGDDDPVFSFQISAGSLINDDEFEGKPDRLEGEAVGAYEIVQGNLVLSANYELTFEASILTILPRPASVTPDNTGKYEGEPDPVLAGTLAGFLEIDGITAEYSRTEGEEIGQYQITAILAPSGNLSNYQVTYNTAVFSIVDNPYPQIVEQPTDQSITYGDSATFSIVAVGNPMPNAVWQTSVDGIVWLPVTGGTGYTLNPETPEVSSNDRLYRAVVSNTFGQVTSLTATLHVNPRPITPIVEVADKVYDGNTTALIAMRALSGVLEGDEVYLAEGIAVFETANTGSDIDVSVTQLTLEGRDALNYVLGTDEYRTKAGILPPVFDGGYFQEIRLTGDNLIGTLPYLSSAGKTAGPGLVTTADGTLSIEIGSGTSVMGWSGNGIQLSITTMETGIHSPTGSMLVAVYEFGPQGLVFDPGITILWDYDAIPLPPGVTAENLVAVYFNGETWVELDGVLDLETRTISVNIQHFSVYGLLAIPPDETESEPAIPETEIEPPSDDHDGIIPTPFPDDKHPVEEFSARYLIAALVGAILAGGTVLVLTRRPESG